MKLRDDKPKQPTLPGDFSPFNPWSDPPPRVGKQRKVTVVVRMTAEEERMARRRAFDMRQYQQEPK